MTASGSGSYDWVYCPRCRGGVSVAADACPWCGLPGTQIPALLDTLPKKPVRWPLWLGIGLVLAGDVVALASNGEPPGRPVGDGDAATATTFLTPPSSAAPTQPPTTARPIPDIAAVPFATPPGFFEPPPDLPDLRNGPLDLAAAAEFGDDPAAARSLLEQHGFERGFARQWIKQGGEETLSIVIEEFRDEAAARSFNAIGTTGDLANPGATRFDVPSAPGGIGVEVKIEEEGEVIYVDVVHFTRERRAFSILYTSFAPIPRETVVGYTQQLWDRT